MLSVVVPVYKEERQLKELLDNILKFEDVEVILAVDASEGDTMDVCNSFTNRHFNVKLTSSPIREGKGAAINRGLDLAEGDLLGYLDGDMSVHPDEMLKMTSFLNSGKGWDIVIGSRDHPDAVLVKNQSFFRKRIGRIYSRMIRLMFKVDLYDFQCGCKVFHRKIWESIPLYEEGFAFDTELLVKSAYKGFKIKEVPVSWTNDTNSKVDPFSDSILMIKSLFRLRKELK